MAGKRRQRKHKRQTRRRPAPHKARGREGTDPAAGAAHAAALVQQGRWPEAEAACRELLRLDPQCADALHLLGILHHQRGDEARAVDLLQRAVRLRPREAMMHMNLAVALHELERYEEAERELLATRDLAPALPGLEYNLGRTLAARGRLREAEACYQRALQANPGDHLALNNLGNVLQNLGRLPEARASFRQAIALAPGYAEAHSNLACTHLLLGDNRASLQEAARAVELNQELAEAWLNLGNAMRALHRDREAAASYERALALNRSLARAAVNLCSLCVEHFKHQEAVRVLEHLRRQRPDDVEILSELVHYRRYLADWRDEEVIIDRVLEQVRRHGQPTNPFGFLGLSMDNADQHACMRNYAHKLGLQRFDADPHTRHRPRAAGEPIRVGFVSSDFRRHVVALLISDLVERVDRERFRFLAYSHGQDDGSVERRRLQGAFDVFADVRECSLRETWQRMADDRVDILIDLKGYTLGNRVQIAAGRPAPLQVRWLGHAATTGLQAFDYLIGDGFATPASAQPHYTENLVELPDCYQVCVRPLPQRLVSRADCGLPPQGTVLCCFNTVYKITPRVFATWMRILRRLPGAVLWLQVQPGPARENLRRHAHRQQVDPARIVFADFLPHAEHLLRYQVADLFLDTLEISACATAADALYHGCPLLTCIGASFASRAAASMLRTANLPELITTDLGAYEELAVDLASSPARLQHLRARLLATRETSPLFDVDRFTRNFESALEHMWRIHLAGERPRPFKVGDKPPAASAGRDRATAAPRSRFLSSTGTNGPALL